MARVPNLHTDGKGDSIVVNDKPLVSIIINNYNYGHFLREAIESALNQTYPHTEVIVVDDGSIDNSREIIAEYGDRIVPVLKENGGQASAFNAGFAVSRGDIIIFLDADDELFPDTVRKIVNVWRTGLSKVQYRLKIVDQYGMVQGVIPSSQMHSGNLKPILLSAGTYLYPPTSGNAFARSFLDSVLPMPENEWRICADGYLNLLSVLHGDIVSLNQPLGLYRIHDSNNYFCSLDHIDVKRLVKRLRDNLLRDYQKENLLRDYFNNCGELNRIPSDFMLRNIFHVRSRIELLCMAPDEYPFSMDTALRLLYHALKATFVNPWLSPLKRVTYMAYFLSMVLFPRSVARRLAFWAWVFKRRPKS